MGLLSFLFGGCGRQPAPLTSSTPKPLPPAELSYSQLDITERFDDHLRLQPDEWIGTVALNASVPGGKGLPPTDASAEEIYAAGAQLSKLRESISIPSDGVYGPVCHIGNTQLSRLHGPCPKCGRKLLKFGWD